MKSSLTDYVSAAAAATALVNTGPEVRAAGDALTGPPALHRFLEEQGLGARFVADEALPAAHERGEGRARRARRPAEPTERDLDEVRALRAEVRAILAAGTPADAVTGANRLVTRAGTGPVLLEDAEGGWEWHTTTAADASLADALGVYLGTGLLGAIRALGHDRFRPCAASDCDGLFVDTSRAGRRRYCTPDLCGNRVNVANHRARRRSS